MNFDYNGDLYNSKKKSNAGIFLGCLGAMCAVTLVVGIVLILNAPSGKNKNSVVKVEEEESKTEFTDPSQIGGDYTGSGLTSDDLDFWDMYKSDEEKHPSKTISDNRTTYGEFPTLSGNRASRERPETAEGDGASGVDASLSDGETYNCADSGEPVLIPIDENIPHNNYSNDNFRMEGSELQYYSNSRKVSSYGIDVSKYQGKIDWEAASNSGIDFAMIRMGVRGYSSANVVFDEEYENNIKGALEHGVETGIYFYSQAVNTQEAVEEANYAVAAAASYNVTYPIVFYTERVTSEKPRTDGLTPEELSNIAKAFCDAVRGYGYRAMIGASKQRLSEDMDPAALSGYDVWLVDAPYLKEGEKLSMSEYPYTYTMWQYSSSGKIDGINGPVDLDISFVDYKYR